MEKTIEQQIAEGVAKGIQQVKNDEIEQKRQKARETASGYVIFFLTLFLTCFIMVSIQSIGIKTFGMDKRFLHTFAYPLAFILQLGFTILFLRQDFKTHFFGAFVVTLINSFGMGYFISLGF